MSIKPEITVIRCFNTPHQTAHCDAFISGLEKLGIPYAYQSGASLPVHTDKVALWGWKWGKYWMERGKDAFVMEMGYIGDRTKYTSLGLNGLNGHATFADYPDDGGQRFIDHGGFIHPWKHNDDSIPLLLGQLKNDQSLQGLDIDQVYRGWAKKMGNQLRFREHPEAVKRGIRLCVPNVAMSEGTLYEAFDDCSYALAFNSNSLLDAIAYGVPAVAMDKGSMVYELCGKGLGDIIRLERETRLYQIAWNQFTLDEISQGWPIEGLLRIS